jgi:hypothetical protein
MNRVVSAAMFTVLILAGCSGSQGVSNPTPATTTLPATPTPSPVVQAEPTACPACPGPTACPPAPSCPEPVTCPTCPTCPEPIVCPQCPESADSLLVKYQLQEDCTAAKLNIELAKIVGWETATYQLFLNEHCQDVVLLDGSPLAFACGIAGIESMGASMADQEYIAQGTERLMQRYCQP